MAEQKESTGLNPPYIPWKSFTAYLAGLKASTTPPILDNTARPNSMAGGLWRQLTSALQFLGLLTPEKHVTPAMKKLVNAYGTDEYAGVAKEILLPPYTKIVANLDLMNATAGQLRKQFETNTDAKGQVVPKSVRFFLHVMTAAGQQYSPLFSMRQEREKRPSRKVAKEQPTPPAGAKVVPPIATPTGTRTWPLYFNGRPDGSITAPIELTDSDCEVIQAQVNVLKLLCSQKPKGSS